MKKTISLLCIALFGYIGNLSAQNALVIVNNTPCPHTIVFYAHDINQPCGSYVSNAYTVTPGTTTTGIPPIQINDATCIPMGGGVLGPIGWQGGACIPATGAFDGVWVDYSGVAPSGVGSPCITGLAGCGYSPSCAVDCNATATWSVVNYVYNVTIQ